MGHIFLAPEPWAGWSGLGLGSLTPEVSLPFFIHHTTMWDCPFPSPCLSAPLLRIWMNVASLNTWFSDFHTAWFSDNSGWYLFCSVVVFFATVVRGGKECLPMPPSWPEVHNFTFLYKLDQSNAVITWAKQLLPVVAGQSKYPAVGLIRNVKPFRRRPTMCIYICYPPVSHLVAFF